MTRLDSCRATECPPNLDGAQPTVTSRESLTEPARAVKFTSLSDFAAVEEPASEPLAGDGEGGAVIPADAFMLVYGAGGAGKTTLVLDLVAHLAAGRPWLNLVVPDRPLRIALIENEGPRPMFRDKLRRKLAAGWQDVGASIFVLEAPWQSLTFRDVKHRDELVRFVREQEIDLLVASPLARLGMEGGGTLDEVGAFYALLADVQRRAQHPLSILVVHHENRAGQVSGAWEGIPDTLVHVQAQGHGRTRLYWQKLRWSSALHGCRTNLIWEDGETFSVDRREPEPEDRIQDGVAEFVLANGGCSWNTVERAVTGKGIEKRSVRDRMLRDGVLINRGKSRGDGKTTFLLWHPDDPAMPPSGDLSQEARPSGDALEDAPESVSTDGGSAPGASTASPRIGDAVEDAPAHRLSHPENGGLQIGADVEADGQLALEVSSEASA